MYPDVESSLPAAREGYLQVANAELYYREVGSGQPIIVLHGGPDFDHNYLLPDLDRLSDRFRLLYYDQRGRGRSIGSVRPEEVTIESEIADLEAVRQYFELPSVAVLGHSWGGLLAMEYAIRHPQHLSHLILMNSAPASRDDYLFFREERLKREPDAVEKLKALSSSPKLTEGDLEADAEYYRIHFAWTLRDPDLLDQVIQHLRSKFTPEGIRKARAIEDRLMDETWLCEGFDLIADLQRLRIPTLVLHGDRDLIPVECAARIAEAIPGARFVLLNDCGHFSYLECPDRVGNEIRDFVS